MLHTDGTNVKQNRKAQQAALTRAALLDAGRALFGDVGFADTSTEDLARAAGVTKGALYHHFDGKDDLFRAVYESVKREIVEQVAPSFTERDPWKSLVDGCQATLDAHLDPSVRRIVLIDGPAVLGWEGVRDVELRYGAVVLRGALRKAMYAGVIERHPLVPLARLLNGALAEAISVVADSDDPVAARDEVGALVVRLLEGLQPRE